MSSAAMMSGEIRQRFLDYFAQRGHEIVPSSSLIPHDDPTLLFTNAGMNQFKSLLLGQERRSYVRATSSQKCMRVSGKHNDLEAVGRDGRHHTFFEMLGNWSFGDYYKREAIEWAWNFLTVEMGLDVSKLYVSVYKDDQESYDIWHDTVGVDASRIYRLGDLEKGDDENFWSMGDTGPCGPCTEIHFDQGVEVANGDDRPLGANESDRYLEIWNLVFIQYDRDANGVLAELPLQSVDTGLGLERLAALKSGQSSNYASDLFTPLLDWVSKASGRSLADDEDRVSMQVIADHARAMAFAVADGGRPGNDGRGYVMRRILRRAARHGRRLGFREPFLYQVADQVIEVLGGHYTELARARDHVLRVIKLEEERFNETLDRGLARFDEFAELARERGDGVIEGEQAFRLHDTFGFPLDLTQVIAEEQSLTVDVQGFERAMEGQRSRARAASKFSTAGKGEDWQWISGGEPGVDRPATRFVGYRALSIATHIIGKRKLENGEFELVLNATPFYAEGGGQVGDVGVIVGGSLRLTVLDTQPSHAGPVHRVRVESGDLTAKPDAVVATVDQEARSSTMRNHTATHLLHAALHRHLGGHAQQAGSLVSPEKLRFDFHHDGAVGREVLDAIEREINMEILSDYSVTKHVDVPIEAAREMGAVSMFGEKYGDSVRVVQVHDLSMEFCGGTHCDHTGQIGSFRITNESAVGAGVRRIEAVTGLGAMQQTALERDVVRTVGERLSARSDEIEARVQGLQSEIKKLQSKLDDARKISAGGAVDDLLGSATEVDGVKVVACQVDVADRDALVQMGDALRSGLKSGVAVVGSVVDGKVAFLAVVTDDLIKGRGLRAGDIVKRVAKVAGGSGGGKPHLAQAGGKDPAKIPAAIAAVGSVVQELLHA